MSILTAIVLILLAAAVLATTVNRERLRVVAGWLSAILILPVLVSYLLTGTDTLSVPLAVRVFATPPQEAGRTALATAVACLLLSIAVLLRRSHPRTADLAAGLVAAISATGLLGYLYGVPDLYAFWVFNTMAVHTAVSLLLLAVAAILSVLGVGWSAVITSPTEGGGATRRQLSVLLIPPAMGWLLAQVHGFVLQCGGKLQMESTPGVGTTVHITLPRAAAPQVQEPTSSHLTVALPTGERRAIVIDDDDAVRSFVVDALADLGFEVRAADGGKAGLALLQDFRPDVAVIDFLMPGMNGAEVARVAQKLHERLPVVFVSGYSDTVALDQIADAVVLRKPFEITDLERALIAVLDLNISQGLRFYNSGAAPLG